MAAAIREGGGAGGQEASPRSPRGPRPKSPPDLYGRRRQLAKVQILEREITYLEEELKTLERVQPTSRFCKEVDQFVTSKPDPLVSINQNSNKSDCCTCSCSVKKWGKSCFKSSWICCCFSGSNCTQGTSNCFSCPCCNSGTRSNCCGTEEGTSQRQRQQQHQHQQQSHQHQAGATINPSVDQNGGCCLCDCIEQICCKPCYCFPVLSGSTSQGCCCNSKFSCWRCCGKPKCCKKSKCYCGGCSCSCTCCCR